MDDRSEYLETRVTMLEGDVRALRKELKNYQRTHADVHVLEDLALKVAAKSSDDKVQTLRWMVGICLSVAALITALIFNLITARHP